MLQWLLRHAELLWRLVLQSGTELLCSVVLFVVRPHVVVLCDTMLCAFLLCAFMLCAFML